MLKFQQLSAFKAVYELGTMTAASKHIHITQPAISRLISNLERQLDFELFQRIKGKLAPTDQGKAFYTEVTKAFLVLDSLKDSARDIRAHQHGSLHISAFPMLSNSFLPSVFGQFIQETPSLKASLKSYRSEEVLRRTEIQSCDVGFSQIDSVSPNITSMTVRGDCVCIVPSDSTLIEKPYLTPMDLAEFPFIRYENEDSTQQELDELFRRAGVSRNDILEVSFANVAATLVSKGLGAAVVDPFTALQAKQSDQNIVIRDFQPRMSFKFYILYPALRPVSTVTKTFVRYFFTQAEAAGINLKYEDIQY